MRVARATFLGGGEGRGGRGLFEEVERMESLIKRWVQHLSEKYTQSRRRQGAEIPHEFLH